LLLRDYVAGFTSAINDYSGTNLIVGSQLITDYRTEKIGIVEDVLFSSTIRSSTSLSMSTSGTEYRRSVTLTTINEGTED
jgi:hypothetical protein